MPLPEQDILQQGDVLAQQRNPGFETEGLPSPQGFDSPDIPSIAPIPIPGTGLTEGNNGQATYLSKFNQAVLGTKDNLTPGNLPVYSAADVYNPRYHSILPGEDSEEAFAKGQPWYKQWGNAIVKFGANVGGTFANGMMSIPDTISSINGGTPYDSAVGNAVDTWLANLEDKFPNYYTKWQQDHPFMSALPGSGGFANFWGDKFLKNLGFTVGAIGSAVVQDIIIGAATEGIGEIPLIANQMGRAALWLNKIFTGTNKAEQLLQLGRAAGRTGEQLLDLQKLAQAAAATKLSNGARYAINLYGATAAEAGFEARDAYNTVREDLVKAYINEKGYSPTGKDLDQIEKYARAAGNVRFGANMAILGISNALQFDAILKPFMAAKAGIRSTIEKDISQRSSIGLMEGSIDEFQRLPKGIWGRVRPLAPSILTEGVFEEGGQFATQIATENFYERKYLYDKGLSSSNYEKDKTPWDSRDHVKNIVHSVVQGLHDEFTTDEGLENVVLGALTGAVFGGVKSFADRNKDRQLVTATLNLLNSHGVTGILQNHYDSAATTQRITEDMKQAAKNNDIFKYKNFQHEQFVNFILSGAKAGRFDVRIEQLKMLKDMDNDAFRQAFGMDKTTDNVKTAAEYVDALIQKAEKLKKSYDLISDTYTNPFRYNPKDTSIEGIQENQKYQTFERWKDDLTFLASIASDVDSRIQSMRQDIRAVYPTLDHYHLSNFTDKKYLKSYSENLAKEVKSLTDFVDSKISTDPAADRARIKLLQSKISDIDSIVDGKAGSRIGNLFKGLLQFHLNGQNEIGETSIPQEAIPMLMNYGMDINRLKKYREEAYKAFDKLSTSEGFDRYFREAENINDQYSNRQQPPAPPVGGPGSPPIPPPAPPKETVKVKDGAREKEFDVDQEYYVTKGNEQQLVIIKGVNQQNGNVVAEIKETGETAEFEDKDFFEPIDESIIKGIDENTSVEDIAPIPKSKVQVKSTDGKTKHFDEGKYYFISINEGENPEKVKVILQVKGKVIVQKEDGKVEEVPADNFFTGDEHVRGVKDQVDTNTSVDDVPPTPPGEHGTKEGSQKKDLSFALFSTTDPVYSRQDTPFNNFHRRHQNFLFDMGSSNPDVFNQDNKPKLRIIPVTSKTEEALGFPKGFASEGSVDDATIRAVYVIDDTVAPAARRRQRDALLRQIQRSKLPDHIKQVARTMPDQAIQDLYEQAVSAEGAFEQMGDKLVDSLLDYGGQGIFFTDSKGEKLARVGQPINPNEIIFSTFASTDLKFQATAGTVEERYTNKQNLDEAATVDWWRGVRSEILAGTTAQDAIQKTYQFAVSRGIPNVINNGAENNPITVGLIRESDLDKPILTVPTLGDVAVMGAFNEEGEGIAAAKGGISMPLGIPLLNYGGNLVFLNARTFLPAEARNIFEMLKIISDRNRTVDSGPLFKYLHKVIYMANPDKGIAPTNSSITITKEGELYLGTDRTPIQLLPVAIEASRDRIISFLEKAHHNIKNSELLKIHRDPKANDLEFVELIASDGNVEVADRWKNYNHYLLSTRTPGGFSRVSPLSTRIAVPQEGERPIIQKYAEVLSFDFDPSKFKKPEQAAPVIQTSEGEVPEFLKTPAGTEAPKQPDSDRESKVQSARAAVARVIADANAVGMTIENLQGLRAIYEQDTNLSVKERAMLMGAVDLVTDRVREKNQQQGVQQQEIESETPVKPTVDLTKFHKTLELKNDNPNTQRQDDLSEEDWRNLEVAIRNAKNESDLINIIDGVTVRGIQHITFVGRLLGDDAWTDKMYNTLLAYGRENISVPLREYLQDTHKAISEKTNPIEQGEGKLSYIQDPRLGDKKLGFRVLSRDSQGNITDIEAKGVINDDGTITPYKDPVTVKQIILQSLSTSEIKQDDSNTDETRSIEDKFKGRNFRRGTDRFRRAHPGNNNYVKADLDKEFAEVKEILPDWFTFKKLDEMLRITGGGLAWGALEDSFIKIYKDAEVGTTYHEAFEAVWYHFVDGKEQQVIYNEFVGREGEFTTYHGEKKKYSDASVKEAKEQLAEEFRDYKMSGQLPKEPKQKSFFQRLLRFIKWLLGLESSDRNRLFKKMNKGYYRNFSSSLRGPMSQPEYSYYREPGLSQFSETTVQDMLQGMTAELFGEIFGENTSIIDSLEEDFEVTAQSIYDRLRERLTFYFEDEASDTGTLFAETGYDYENAANDDDRAAIIQQMNSIRAIWNRIRDNWGSFVKEHERYLRMFNAEFVIDDEGEIAIQEGQATDEIDSENKAQSEYARDIMTIDAKNNASNRVKLLIASVADSEWVREATRAGIAAADSVRSKRESSSLRLPKLVQYAKLFNYLLHNTAGINGIYDIWTKLTSMTEDIVSRKVIDANVRKLMSRLKFDGGFEGKTPADMRMILSTEGALTKQKPAFFRQFTDFQRNTYFKTTVLNSKIEQVKSTWIASIKGSKAIVPSAENRFLFSRAVLGTASNVEFLNRIGIDITQADYRRLRGTNINKFNDAVNSIRSLVERAARDRIAIPIVSSRQLDFDSRLNALAELYVVHMVGEDTQSQHPNLDNEQTSNFVLPNYVATMIHDANNALDKEDFISRQDNGYFDDIFHQDSILLNKIFFDAAGEKNKEVQMGVVEGRETWDRNNRSTSSLTEAERLLYEINNNLNGVFYTLLPADAKTEWAINVGTYLSADGFFGDDSSRSNEITAFSNQMYKWLQTEVALARDFENRKFIDNLRRKPRGEDREVGKSLRFFKDILPKTLVDDIHSRVIDGNTPLEELVSEQQMRALMREYAYQRAQDTLNELIDWKLIQQNPDGRFALFGFDKIFTDKHLDRDYYHDRQRVERLLLFREMNYILNNIEMHKFFFGDPAQYKDELKRIKSFLSGREYTHVDMLGTSEGFNQRANEILNTTNPEGNGIALSTQDPGYQFFKNHFNTLTAFDVTFESNMIEEIQEAIGEKSAAPYKEGNEDDAGAYMTIQAYREMMWKASGRWTNKQEKWFQWEMAWERNDKAREGKYVYSSNELRKHDEDLLKTPVDTEVAVPILKLMHSGIQTKEGTAIASLDKASWAPLVYRWYKDTALGELYDAMQKRGIDYVRMESAHKVGIQRESIFTLYNEEGNVNSAAFDTLVPEMIPIKQIGIQVEQAKKEKGQTEGSQLRKIAIGDLRENGVPIDFQGRYRSHQEAFDAWNALETTEQKVAASPIYAKIKRHNDALVNLTTIRTVLTMRRLGMVVSDEDGNVTVPDKRMISDFILSELERRELPRNIASAIQISPETRDFSNPIEANPQYSKIRAIIYSILEKTVTRPKVNGGQKTMLSVTGMEKGPRIIKRTVNGKVIYTADTLKFYKQNDTGTEACEVMLPYWFGKKLLEAGSGRTKEEVLEYLNSTKEGQKLLRGIGFRIPTQGLNSVDFFVVKDFLPEQMGDVVVLPSEITVKAGSDFDIDKLNVYLYNYYIDAKSGFPEMVSYRGSEQATKEHILRLIHDGNISDAGIKAELDEYIGEQLEEVDETQLFDDISLRDFRDRLIEDFLAERQSNTVDLFYQKTLENEYFESIEALLSLPENYSRLITPNDASELKGYRNKMLELKGQSSTPLGDYGKLLSSTFMMKERQAYMASKQVVGISAVSQTAQAIAQNLEGGLLVHDRSYVARFPANTVNGLISLGSLKVHGSDKLISNINSQTTDGGVDVAKDKFLAEMGINKDTLATFLTLVRMGADPWWAILYLNQPAIQEFLKEKAISESVSQINPNVKSESGNKLLKETFKKFGDVGKNKKNIANKPKYYAIKTTKNQPGMEEMIQKYAQDPNSLTVEEKRLQMMMLDDFSNYDRSHGKWKGYNGLAWDVFHFYQGYNWDTARMNDPNLTRLKALKYEKANDLGITPASTVMRDTFIGPMMQSILQLDEGLRSVINVQHGAAGSVLDDIARDVFRMKGGEAVKQQILLTAELSMVDYAIQTNALVEGRSVNTMISSLLLSNNATALYLDALRHHEDKRLSENPLIKALIPIIDRRPGYPSLVVMLERDYDTYTSNVLTDSLRELKDDATVISISDNPNDDRTVAQIYRRLVLTGIIEGGAKSGRGSYAHLIPSETYSEIVRDSLRNMRLDGFYENLALYRGNWMNSSLVPNSTMELTQEEYEQAIAVGDLNPQPYYRWFVNPRVSQALSKAMALTPGQHPMLLTQPADKYRRFKVIKMEETRRDEITRQIIERRIRLFRRVDVLGENGVVPLQYDRNRILYVEINPWGDQGIREFYNTQNQSVLPINAKVPNEANDDQILYALVSTGVETNAAEHAIVHVINEYGRDNDEGGESDEAGNEPPVQPTPTDTMLQIDNFEQFKNQLTKKCN